jgi:hypothetical protein
MKKNYTTLLLTVFFGYLSFAQTVLFEQAVDGTNGIVSDFVTDVALGTYSADDFVLDDSYVIQTIFTPGFNNAGDIGTLMTGLSVYIYADNAGVPDSNPTLTGTGLLEILDLAPTSPAISITDNDITVDVTMALGSELVLPAGTYWLIMAPTIATLGERWNWFQSSAGGNAQIFDEGNFGAAFDWTSFGLLGLDFDSLAFTISGSLPLSIGEVDLNGFSVSPNPAKDVLYIENLNTSELLKVELFSVLGKLVYKGNDTATIDISQLNSGVYMLRITDGKRAVTKRIIKE